MESTPIRAAERSLGDEYARAGGGGMRDCCGCLEFRKESFVALVAAWARAGFVRRDRPFPAGPRATELSSGLPALRGDGGEPRCVCTGDGAERCCGEMDSELGRSGLDRLCVVVCRRRICLGQPRATAVLLDLDELLLRVLRDFHAVAGAACAQPGSFAIRLAGSVKTHRTRALNVVTEISPRRGLRRGAAGEDRAVAVRSQA